MNLIYKPDQFTRSDNNGTSIIDYFIVNNNNYFDFQVKEPIGKSDHNKLIIKLNNLLMVRSKFIQMFNTKFVINNTSRLKKKIINSQNINNPM